MANTVANILQRKPRAMRSVLMTQARYPGVHVTHVHRRALEGTGHETQVLNSDFAVAVSATGARFPSVLFRLLDR